MKLKSQKILLLVLFFVTTFAFAYGYGLISDSLNASGHDRRHEKAVDAISESFRITENDGVQSLARLILERTTVAIPNQQVSRLHFFVSSTDSELILTQREVTPETFEFGIAPNTDKAFPVLRLPFKAPVLLDNTFVRTPGVCNFFVRIEFYPRWQITDDD